VRVHYDRFSIKYKYKIDYLYSCIKSNDIFSGASEEFDKNFLLANFVPVERARVIYTSGHMLPGI
jgi:hypothetical protein